MIDPDHLLDSCKALVSDLVEDLRERCDHHDETKRHVRTEYDRAQTAGRTGRSFEEWLEGELAQVAVSWVLSTVFVRFSEDNGLVEAPLLSGPGRGFDLARDHRVAWLADHPEAGDRDWLREVFTRYRELPVVAELFGATNPVWELSPSADGCKQILELWWEKDDAGALRHDFTDADLDTRFLGDLYQDLSDHAKKTYALLQTPVFVEEFILDRTLDPAIDTFGLDEVTFIDPTCGSGHFLLGAFNRLLGLWREREPATPTRELAERVLQAVHGVDLNPYAAAIAQFRLLVAALKAAEIDRLSDAPNFTINIAVGDSLLHGPRADQMWSAAEQDLPLLRHAYETEDRDEAERILQPHRYHAVAGNPPYITVKDPALRDAYREMYETAYGQYHLVAPFMERFFDLARPAHDGDPAGYVGAIVSNGFTKRQFGTKFVEDYLPTKDLTTIVDTSGAYIPGHKTPTVLLFGRNQSPQSDTVRAVLGIRGESGKPRDAAAADVWGSIVRQIDRPGSEDEYTSCDDVARERFAEHPWSLQGGAAPDILRVVNVSGAQRLSDVLEAIGFMAITGEDNFFVVGSERTSARVGAQPSVPLGRGDGVRDWRVTESHSSFWPYRDRTGRDLVEWSELPSSSQQFAWPFRRSLIERKRFGVPVLEAGLKWFEWRELYVERLGTPLSIVFAEVASHNHFVLDRGGRIFKQTAPVIKLPEGASEGEHLALIGLLNSSVGDFWTKQTVHKKTQAGGGGGASDAPFTHQYQRAGTKMADFPLPTGKPEGRASQLDELAQGLHRVLPSSVLKHKSPSRDVLDHARAEVEQLRGRMVALQEELDWECYRLYGLLDEELTLPTVELPPVKKGQRAFEIALAREQAAGNIETSWFGRNDCAPVPEIPEEWPQSYRSLVARRIEIIGSDRKIQLLEKPEYKRRWNWDSWEKLEKRALRQWLLDRMEAEHLWTDPELTTTAKLADALLVDSEFVGVAQLWDGNPDVELADVVQELATAEAVPYVSALRYTSSGMRRRAEWEQVWVRQRAEDAIDARSELPAEDPEHLSEEETELLKKHQVGEIPVPPKYRKSDYADDATYPIRGRMDVPRERFIAYPGTAVGADTSPVIGWAGWDHLQQAQALAGHYTSVRDEVGNAERLKPLLAGLLELVPWLKQWHNDYDETYGQRLGDFFESFVQSETARINVTLRDLTELTPVQLDDAGNVT